MKTPAFLLSLILFFGFGFSLQAQAPQIQLKGEKIVVDEQVYGYLVKEGSGWMKNFSFQSLRDEELAYAKAMTKVMANGHHYDYYEISFKGYAQKAEMDIEVDFDKRLAFDLVLYNIVKNNLLNRESVEKFLARYPPTISKRLDGNL